MSINTIEVWGEPVGLAAETDAGFRYFAADRRTRQLDGRRFPTIGHARLAAIRALRSEVAAPGEAQVDLAALGAAARSLDRAPVGR
jgi:hypothetical protein